MSSNMRDIQDRMNTVKSTSQITNAMKLVSMSKFQQYTRRKGGLDEFVRELKKIPTKAHDQETIDGEKSLAICFSADLGLASLYQNSLYSALVDSGIKNVVWIGKKLHDRVLNDSRFNVLNDEVLASEAIDLDELFQDVLKWMKDYQIFVATPRLVGGESVRVDWVTADEMLDGESDVEFAPDYEATNARFVEMNTLLTLYASFYEGKTTEHMVRRLAMDTATDNAQALHEDLQLQYNRLRQERITQEILELSSGMESS